MLLSLALSTPGCRMTWASGALLARARLPRVSICTRMCCCVSFDILLFRSLYLSLSLSLSLPLSLSLAHSLSFVLCLSLYLSLYISLSLSGHLSFGRTLG